MDFDPVVEINEAIEKEKKNPSIERLNELQELVNKQVSYDVDRETLTNAINAEIDKLDPTRNIDKIIPSLDRVSSQISNLTPEQLAQINAKINTIPEPKKTQLNKIISAITAVPAKRSMFSMFGRGTRRKSRKSKGTKRKTRRA